MERFRVRVIENKSPRLRSQTRPFLGDGGNCTTTHSLGLLRGSGYGRSLFIGYRRLAIGYRRLAIGYRRLAIGYWRLAIGYRSLSIRPPSTTFPVTFSRICF
jgi:hypothetical protein